MDSIIDIVIDYAYLLHLPALLLFRRTHLLYAGMTCSNRRYESFPKRLHLITIVYPRTLMSRFHSVHCQEVSPSYVLRFSRMYHVDTRLSPSVRRFPIKPQENHMTDILSSLSLSLNLLYHHPSYAQPLVSTLQPSLWAIIPTMSSVLSSLPFHLDWSTVCLAAVIIHATNA